MPWGWIFAQIIGDRRSTKVAKMMVIHWCLTFLRRSQICFPMYLHGPHTFVWEKCWEFQTTSSEASGPMLLKFHVEPPWGRGMKDCLKGHGPASVAQLDAPSDWRPGGRGFKPPPPPHPTPEVGNILSWRLIMKYFLRSFSPFRWFKKGSCQFLAKECAQYWLTT